MVLSRTGLISRVTTLFLISITADDSLSTDILLSSNGNSRQHLLLFSAAAPRPCSPVSALFRFTNPGTLFECRVQITLLFTALHLVYDSGKENQPLFAALVITHDFIRLLKGLFSILVLCIASWYNTYMRIDLLPDYAKPYKTKGYDVRVVNGVYRLIKISSKRVPGKKYPVLQQEFIGIIDKDKGLIPKKTYPSLSADSLEFGLSNFIYLNFRRDLQRLVFGGDRNFIYSRLAIIFYIYGSVDLRFLKLSFLSCRDEELQNCSLKCSIKRLSSMAGKIDLFLASAIPDDSDRLYLISYLRQVTVSRNTIDSPKLQYTNEILTLFDQYGLKYE